MANKDDKPEIGLEGRIVKPLSVDDCLMEAARTLKGAELKDDPARVGALDQVAASWMNLANLTQQINNQRAGVTPRDDDYEE